MATEKYPYRSIIITGMTSGLGQSLFAFSSKSPHNKNKEYTTKVYSISKPKYDLSTFSGLEKARKLMIDLSVHLNEEIHLINNAGVFVTDNPDKERSNYWCFALKGGRKLLRDMVTVNLLAPYYLTKLAVDLHFESVINIASVSGHNGEEDAALYAATKAGVIGLSKSFARLAPKIQEYCLPENQRRPTRVNSISPGYIRDTNLVPGGDDSVFPEWGKPGYPAEKEEIHNVIEMLLSTPSINGVDIIIDGGYLL